MISRKRFLRTGNVKKGTENDRIPTNSLTKDLAQDFIQINILFKIREVEALDILKNK